jgi:hypothetical protein
MSVTVIEPATVTALTTLDRVRRELGIVADTDDLILDDLITRASSAIARETRRVFGIETVTETLDGSGTRLLGLSRTPILEITEVTEDSAEITDYLIEDDEAGALYRAAGWGRSGGLRMWGTEAFSSGYILPGYQDQRYSVTYEAGYSLPEQASPTLPGAVEQACLETVKAWYSSRDVDPSISSVKVGQLAVSYRDQSSSSTPMGSLPMAALGLLRNYYARPIA